MAGVTSSFRVVLPYIHVLAVALRRAEYLPTTGYQACPYVMLWLIGEEAEA